MTGTAIKQGALINKVGPWAFYAGCGLTPMADVRFVGDIPAQNFAFILAGVIALSVERTHLTRLPKVFVVATGLGVVALILVSVETGAAGAQVATLLRMMTVWLLLPISAFRLISTGKMHHTAVLCLVIGSAISGLVAFGQFLGFDARPLFLTTSAVIGPYAEVQARFIGLNSQANGEGGCLAVALVICVGCILSGVYRRWNCLLLTPILAGLLLSGSITGLIAMCVGVVVLICRSRGRRFLGHLSFLLGGLWGIYLLLRSVLPSFTTPLDRWSDATGVTGISTVGARMDTVKFAVAAVSQHPLTGRGFGPGAAGTYDGLTAAHNIGILAWYQGGPMLFLAVVMMMLTGLVVGWRRSTRKIDGVLFASTLAVLFFAQTGPALFERYVWLPVVLLLLGRRYSTVKRSHDDYGDPSERDDAMAATSR